VQKSILFAFQRVLQCVHTVIEEEERLETLKRKPDVPNERTPRNEMVDAAILSVLWLIPDCFLRDNRVLQLLPVTFVFRVFK